MLFTVLAWFMAFWSMISLLDYFLRSFHVSIYMAFVERYELNVTLFQVNNFTTLIDLNLHLKF